MLLLSATAILSACAGQAAETLHPSVAGLQDQLKVLQKMRTVVCEQTQYVAGDRGGIISNPRDLGRLKRLSRIRWYFSDHGRRFRMDLFRALNQEQGPIPMDERHHWYTEIGEWTDGHWRVYEHFREQKVIKCFSGDVEETRDKADKSRFPPPVFLRPINAIVWDKPIHTVDHHNIRLGTLATRNDLLAEFDRRRMRLPVHVRTSIETEGQWGEAGTITIPFPIQMVVEGGGKPVAEICERMGILTQRRFKEFGGIRLVVEATGDQECRFQYKAFDCPGGEKLPLAHIAETAGWIEVIDTISINGDDIDPSVFSVDMDRASRIYDESHRMEIER